MSEKRIAIYPGTFDPITNGHIDILLRACDLFDEVIVTIARNPAKETTFTLEERFEMIQEVIDEGLLPKDKSRVEVLDGLSVEGAEQFGAGALVRGLRAVSDFEYEFQMALMNRHLAPKLHTVYLMPKDEYTYLSSTIIKGVARHGGDIRRFVPRGVERRLFEMYGFPLKP
ncbi:pantetheine-phosphate adenylyltransferase [bacterium]|nr:pantetheine-phosphate adenylyltransferase [bacterium]